MYRGALVSGMGHPKLPDYIHANDDFRLNQEQNISNDKKVTVVGKSRSSWDETKPNDLWGFKENIQTKFPVFASSVACVQTITKLWLVPEFNFVCPQATSSAEWIYVLSVIFYSNGN